jgi:hypothetical protein
MLDQNHQRQTGAFCGPAKAFAASCGYVASSVAIQTQPEADNGI